MVKPKHFEWLKPRFDVSMTNTEGGVQITVKSDVFAKGVYIDFDEDVKMSDNFFDIADKNGYTVNIETELSKGELEKSLKIMSVYDIGE